MSVTIQSINEALEGLTADWNWDFAYAPKPGQQRVKITAQNRRDPKQVKVIILAEDLFKKLPVGDVAKNILRLLPSIPNSDGTELRSNDPAPPIKIKPAAGTSAQRQYQQLRRTYQQNLVQLQTIDTAAPATEADWTTNFGRSVTRFFAGVSRKFAHTN